MDLPTFLTIEEADEILGNNEPWNSASDSDKQEALGAARSYTEFNYSIRFKEADGVPDKVKYGNALIANEDLINDIFNRQKNQGSLEAIETGAGSAKVSKKYTNKVSKTWWDPFPRATQIMNPYCVLKSGSSMRIKSLVRN